MQMRQSRIFLSVVTGALIAFSPTGWAKRAPASEASISLRQAFIDKTQIHEGDLQIANSNTDKACQNTFVQILEVDGEVLLEFGAHAIVRGINHTSGVTVDRKCKTKIDLAVVESRK